MSERGATAAVWTRARAGVVLATLCLWLVFASVASATVSWSSPTLADVSLGTSPAISCPTTTFCAIVGQYGNVSMIETGTVSSDVAVPGVTLNSVSCASATFCMAVGEGRWTATWNGSSWSAPATVPALTAGLELLYGGDLASVSCPSASFCVALDTVGYAYTYDGHSWTASASQVDPAAGLEPVSVSCASSAFCVEFDSGGNAMTYTNGSWGSPASVEPSGDATSQAVSCAPTDSTIGTTGQDCVAVNGSGNAATFTGGTWQPAVTLPSAATDVSCVSTTLCIAVDASGNAYGYVPGGSWPASSSASLGDSVVSLGCAPETLFCGAVTPGNAVALLVDGAWSAPSLAGSGALTAISCPSEPFCMAVDANGRALVFDGSGWTGPVQIAPIGYDFAALSCASITFCVAGGAQGTSYAFNGTGWSSASTPFAGQLTSLSCVSSSFCVGVDETGVAATFNGTEWSSTTIAAVHPVSVSCTSTTFCLEVNADGTAYTYDGSAWTQTGATQVGSFTGVSCANSTLCAATGYDGDDQYNGASWLGTSGEPPQTETAVSCTGVGGVSPFCGSVALDGVSGGAAGSRFAGYDWTLISCASVWFCAAASASGAVTVMSGPPQLAIGEGTALPSISGSAVVGQTLTVAHALWSFNGSVDTDQWQRCNAGGSTCVPITGATGQTYTPTSADVGSTITVAETATDYAGTSTPATSLPTAVVTAPIGMTGTTGTSGTGTVAVPPNAALTKRLKALLKPTGKGARIPQLFKSGAYRYRIDWPVKGVMVIEWSTPGAHRTTTLLARATLRIGDPGKLAFTVDLVQAGRRALAHAKHLKMTVAGLFIGGVGEDASATTTVRLSR